MNDPQDGAVAPPSADDPPAPSAEESARPRLLLPDKEFFNIGEACRILQVPVYTLRYWEAQFGGLRPTRRPSGHRRYSRRDLETAALIKDLLQNKKMTVAGARKVLADRRKGGRAAGAAAAGSAHPAALKLLRQVRDELRQLADELSR